MEAGTFDIIWLSPIAHQYSLPATEELRNADIFHCLQLRMKK